jgi:hypothetical protein
VAVALAPLVTAPGAFSRPIRDHPEEPVKTFYTPNGDKWSCVRNDHDHLENGRNVPCMACRREQTVSDRNRVGDAVRQRL